MMALLHLRTVYRSRGREAGAVSVGLLVALISIAITLSRWTPGSEWMTAETRRAAFVETIVEAGTVSAARVMLYSSTLTGVAAKLVHIVPEGSAVRAGDVLMRFDSSTLEQALQRERATFEQVRAELVAAREELRLEGARSRAESEAAERQIEYARSQVQDQESGRGKVALAEADAAATEAARELQRAKAAYDDLQPLLAEGFVTRAELDRAEQTWTRAQELKQLADLRRTTLAAFERPAAVNRSRSELNEAEEARNRQRDTAAARTAQRQATVHLIEARLRELDGRIAQLASQIDRTIITSQSDGLVVYRDLFFGSDRRKPQIGDEVWPNQPVIAVPDPTSLVIETQVREVDLHKVGRSQNVRVTFDAYPDLHLDASVGLIGALAQDDPSRAGTKRFPVTVQLRSADHRLRAGMTARVSIEVASIHDALIVPTEAVLERDGERFCFVVDNGTLRRQRIDVRAENATSVAVAAGVAAADRVVIPRSAAEATDLLRR